MGFMGNQLSVSNPFLSTDALLVCSKDLVLAIKLVKTSSTNFTSGKLDVSDTCSESPR